jgi:glycosyltransferase involved in cell wall biosynthesis
MISRDISKRILTIGQAYIDPRGGMAEVIRTYSGYFSPFKFIATYNAKFSKYLNVFFFAFSLVPLTLKLTTDRQIKVLHIHGAERGSFFRKFIVFLLAKYVFGKRIIYHSHGAEFHEFYNGSADPIKMLVRFFISNMEVVICLSEQWKHFYEGHFAAKNIVILENIIDRAENTLQKIKTDSIRILFLGEIGQRKGIFDLLEVISKHKEYFTGKIQLTIGGNGDTDRLETFINLHELRSLVRFEGWVSGAKKRELLSTSDLYILPSYNEGLPISILEAMSYKLAIISTHVGGISEVLHDGVNGYVVVPGDHQSLFDGLNRFITNPSEIYEMGSKSFELVTPFYAESVIPKLESIYLRTLS